MLTVTYYIWQVCVLYLLEFGQIQHTCAFKVYNMEIKVHFSL